MTREEAENAASLLKSIERIETLRRMVYVSAGGETLDDIVGSAAYERIKAAIDAEIEAVLDDLQQRLTNMKVSA